LGNQGVGVTAGPLPALRWPLPGSAWPVCRRQRTRSNGPCQRTTLDILNAQQELVNARVALVTAQHDRVVVSYTLLAAVGGLSMARLGLDVLIYDPQVHYQQVRDAWIGVRNPDGR